MEEKILITKTQLQGLVDYIVTILDFVDVEEEENVSYVNNEFNASVQPIIDLLHDNSKVTDSYKIARQVDIELFKESLEDVYDVNISKLSDKQIENLFDDVQDSLAGNDQYSEIYNNAVNDCLKEMNL